MSKFESFEQTKKRLKKSAKFNLDTKESCPKDETRALINE
jgi:hypothetical protein